MFAPTAHTAIEENSADELCPERRVKSRQLQNARIAVSHGKSSLVSAPLIESTREGARLIMSGKAKKDQPVEFVVSIENNSFLGEARIAWTMPLSNGRAVVGLEFITFHSVGSAA